MQGTLFLAVWLDCMSCRPTTKAARSMEAGSNLCQGIITPSGTNHGHTKGQHWCRIPCRSQVLCALCLLTCIMGMWLSKASKIYLR